MIKPGQALVRALGVHDGDLVALVGGGGKSSLLFALGEAYPRPTVLSTTTRIFSAQTRLAPCLSLAKIAAGRGQGRDLLSEMLAEHGRCLVIGELSGQKATGVAPDLPARWLSRPDVALVVVEADGARMRPLKAPAAHEPALPASATLLVVMAGIDALGRPVEEVAHRPELVCELAGLQPGDAVSEEAMALLLTHPDGGLKGLPDQTRCVVAINKVDGEGQLEAGRRLAGLILRAPQVERVLLLSLQCGRVDVVE